MAALYPSLEDLAVDQMAQAQVAVTQHAISNGAVTDGVPAIAQGSLYAGLGLEEFLYAGMDISEQAIQQYVPQDVAQQMVVRQQHQPIVSVTAPGDLNLARAEIKNGVRELILAKNENGKLGLAVKSIEKGLFVAFVWKDSAAAMCGLRFGEQILQINGESVAGWSDKKALTTLRNCDGTRVSVIVRDRPFERVITVVKDHLNQIGFIFKKGEITAIVKDSSAARNGLLIHHQLVEVNGQNVIGLPDKDIAAIMKEAPRSVALTIMPSFLYKQLVKKIGYTQIKKFMDHSIPEI